MRTSRWALAVASFGIGAAVAVAVTLVVTGTGSDSRAADSASPGAIRGTVAPPGTSRADGPATAGPPKKDAYCPAFQAITRGGFSSHAKAEEDGADLDELGRKFDELIVKYAAAARVSPLSLRDDYGRALGFLRQGSKAVTSGDLNQIRALVTNLDTLNSTMAAIDKKSTAYCR